MKYWVQGIFSFSYKPVLLIFFVIVELSIIIVLLNILLHIYNDMRQIDKK